jgi:hypothetical protein
VVLARPCMTTTSCPRIATFIDVENLSSLLRSLSYSLPLHLLRLLAMGRAEPGLSLLPRALRTLLLPMSRHLSMPLPWPPSMPQHRYPSRPSQHVDAVAMVEPKRELGAAAAISADLNYQSRGHIHLRTCLFLLYGRRASGGPETAGAARPWWAVPVVTADVRGQPTSARGRANSGRLGPSRAVP